MKGLILIAFVLSGALLVPSSTNLSEGKPMLATGYLLACSILNNCPFLWPAGHLSTVANQRIISALIGGDVPRHIIASTEKSGVDKSAKASEEKQ